MRRIYAAVAVLALCAGAPRVALATVSTASTSTTQYGDGASKAFPVPFPFLAATDLTVTVNGDVKASGTDYSVTKTSPTGSSTGTVTFSLAPASGTTVLISRAVPLLQPLSLLSQGVLSMAALEAAYDRGTMGTQQVNARVSAVEASSTASAAGLQAGIIQEQTARANADAAIMAAVPTLTGLSPSGGVLDLYTDFHVIGDGTDEAAAFQSALNASIGRTLRIRPPQSAYTVRNILIPSNIRIQMDPGVVFTVPSGIGKWEFLMRAHNVQNVEIIGYGATLRMLKAEYVGAWTLTGNGATKAFTVTGARNVAPGTAEAQQFYSVIDNGSARTDWSISSNTITFTTAPANGNTVSITPGEWRHAFMIEGSTNVHVAGLALRDSGGDGLIIGAQSGDAQPYCLNVYIEDVVSDNNRRQGLSIVSGKHVYVRNSQFTNTNGTAPQAGIDIEPDYANHEMTDIRLSNIYTAANAGAGIQLHVELGLWTKKHVSISVVDHEDDGSAVGFQWSGSDLVNSVRADVVVDRPVYRNNTSNGISVWNKAAAVGWLTVRNPVIIDSGGGDYGNAKWTAGISIGSETGEAVSGLEGGVVIVNPVIRETRTPAKMVAYISTHDEAGTGFKDIRIIDPIELSGITWSEFTAVEPGSYVTDRYKQHVWKLTTSASGAEDTIQFHQWAPTITNEGAAGDLIYNLPTLTYGIAPTTFEVVTAHKIRLKLYGTTTATGALTVGAGGYVETSTVGARISFRTAPDKSKWIISDVNGTWTVGP